MIFPSFNPSTATSEFHLCIRYSCVHKQNREYTCTHARSQVQSSLRNKRILTLYILRSAYTYNVRDLVPPQQPANNNLNYLLLTVQTHHVHNPVLPQSPVNIQSWVWLDWLSLPVLSTSCGCVGAGIWYWQNKHLIQDLSPATRHEVHEPVAGPGQSPPHSAP